MHSIKNYRWLGVVALSLIISLGQTGCGTLGNIFGGGNDEKKIAASFAAFGDAHKIFTGDQTDYANVRATLRAARIARKIDDEKWLNFRISQGAIQAAAPIVEADLDTWGATGKKPEMFDAHQKTLRDALAEVMSIAKEFQ